MRDVSGGRERTISRPGEAGKKNISPAPSLRLMFVMEGECEAETGKRIRFVAGERKCRLVLVMLGGREI